MYDPPSASPHAPSSAETSPTSWSRRMLDAPGIGADIAQAGLAGGRTAHAASAMNGARGNPALGDSPNGEHYGAPRDGGAHTGQDVPNAVGAADYAPAAGPVVRRPW